MMAAITFVPQDPATMSATDPSAWIGRSQRIDDHLSHNLLARIAATFGQPAPVSYTHLTLPTNREV